MALDTQGSNFFDGANFDWESYMNARPTYSPEFYNIVFDYHTAKGGQWHLAHDVGTGPGQVAEVLAERFEKVVASDASEYHIAVARSRVAGKLGNIIEVQHCAAEALSESDANAAGSFDLITAAEVIGLLDVPKAIAGFGKLLRSGGTLAIWFYGRPIFAEEGQEKSQDIYNKIIFRAFDRMRPFKGTNLERGWVTLSSWLDCAALPEEEWEDVKRMKWNSDKPLSFIDDDLLDFEMRYESKIGAHEQVDEKVDRDFWAKEGDINWVRGFVTAQLPWKSNDDDIAKEQEVMYEELEDAMGGKGKKRKIAWPVVLILATKK